jgi:hypothetical protein
VRTNLPHTPFHSRSPSEAPRNRSRRCERSTAANKEQNYQDDDHKRHQPATDVHDVSPFSRLSKVHPWSLRPSRNTENKKSRRGGTPEGMPPRRPTH